MCRTQTYMIIWLSDRKDKTREFLSPPIVNVRLFRLSPAFVDRHQLYAYVQMSIMRYLIILIACVTSFCSYRGQIEILINIPTSVVAQCC